jgi:Ion channel
VDVVLTLAGIALIALALRDIFETLFHPLGRGVIARHIVLGVWVAARRLTTRATSALVLAGPLAYVIVIACWAGMLIVGWALIFLPHLPDGYVFDPGLVAADHDGFEDALYISLVNISSLGYGDISPQSALLRILGPTETIFGLALLTASISWLVSIYNALTRRNTFAHEVHLTREAESELGEKLADADPELLERMLTSFMEQLIATRRDLIHFPIIHYFQSEEDQLALAELLPFLRRLVEEAGEEARPRALRVRAQMLRMAIDDYAQTLRTRLELAGDTTDATLEELNRQRRPPTA